MFLNVWLSHRIHNITVISLNHDYTEQLITDLCTDKHILPNFDYAKCQLFHLSVITEGKLNTKLVNTL